MSSQNRHPVSLYSAVGLILLTAGALSTIASDPVVEAPAHVAPAAPYAEVKVMMLGDVLPLPWDSPDVHVRLIAIKGAILVR